MLECIVAEINNLLFGITLFCVGSEWERQKDTFEARLGYCTVWLVMVQL